jgi:SAM-dependent methyltransferase
MNESEIKKTVREGYAQKAKTSGSCCRGQPATADDIGKKIGYTEEELGSVPRGANLGLGCGNPLALASLKEGDIVLDLGSGAGFDAFLASSRVGERGRVIGVDMTPEMLDQARANAREGGYRNVEFRLGEIENLPVSDSSVDVIISNCVINLSPDKQEVFGEAFRALKPGGRLMVSDIVLLGELPDFIKQSAAAYIGCISGALMKEDYLKTIREARFHEVRVLEETFLSIDCMANDPTTQAVINKIGVTTEDIASIEKAVASVRVSAVKPA